MSLQRTLSEQFSFINSNKITERKKCLERISDVLCKEDALRDVAQSVTWQTFLDATKSCLKQECDRIAKKNGSAARSTGDQVFTLISDIFGLIIKNAFQKGHNTIKISELIRYMDGCLRERNMRICRDTFLVVLKDYILSNYICLGYVLPKDFILIFELLKVEFNHNHANDVIIYNCLMLLLKHSPNCGLPAYYLREQFTFMSTFCQSINANDSKAIHSCVMECVVYFCKHTVEDNRRSCIKLGEEIFMSLLDLYKANDHEWLLKEKFLEFCLLQINIHNPCGVTEEEENALAHSWNTWNKCVKVMYEILRLEIKTYLRYSVKNTLFFKPEGSTVVILNTFVSLFVEVLKQLFSCNLSLDASSSIASDQPQIKRRKCDKIDIVSYINVDEPNNWIWIKLVGAALDKYPELVTEQSFMQLLRNLQLLQSKAKDNNTTRYIYELQAILVDVQKHLNLPYNEELSNLWKVIGKSTISAVELNHNIEATQTLLQKLIQNELVELESTIEIYKPGVLTITEHHIKTAEVLFQQIQFSDLPRATRMDILRCLLNFENVKDFMYFLEPDFATVIVSLMVKQYTQRKFFSGGKTPDEYQYLRSLYSKRNFDLKDIIEEKEATDDTDYDSRMFNYDSKMLELFYQHIGSMHEYFQKESAKNQLCIFGLLGNVLNNLVQYKIVSTDKMEECDLFSVMRDVINNDNFIHYFHKYVTHDVRLLRECLEIILLLDKIWCQRHAISDYIRNITPLDFLRKLFDIVNHIQTGHRSEEEHTIKLGLIRALSKYSLISNSGGFNDQQVNIMRVLSNADCNFTNEIEYKMSICFLETIKYTNVGILSEDIIENILKCLSEICSERFRSFENAKEILGILKYVYTHLDSFHDTRHKTEAISFLRDFYNSETSYSPDIAIAILECVEVLSEIPNDTNCREYTGIGVIKLIPTRFLSSEYQRVRYKAIKVLVKFVKRSSGTNKLEDIHQLEELFCRIYDNNLDVFAVDGDLTQERRSDETEFRTLTALYMFVALIINCHDWIEENLFALIKLEHEKKLFQLFDNNILNKIMTALETHFESPGFLKKHLEYLLTKWLESGLHLNDFPFKLLNCADKSDFYKNHFDICVPLLIMKDRDALIKAAQECRITESELLEKSCTKIFAKALIDNITKVGPEIIQKIPVLLDVSRKLGNTMTDILVEYIDDVLLHLLTSISDSEQFHKTFQENIIFVHSGITYPEFQRCLAYIEKELARGTNIIENLIEVKLHLVQKMLLELQSNIYSAIAEKRFKRFHQYSIFVDIVVQNIKPHHKFITYFVRDTIYFLINLVKQETRNLKLSQMVLVYTETFLRKIIPDKVEVFEDFAIYTINSIKNVTLLNTNLAKFGVRILEYLVVDESLQEIVKKLDIFPSKPEFSRINIRHAHIKYSGKDITLADEIKSFVDYDRDMLSREDSLKHLKTLLATKKDQLVDLYNSLDSADQSDNPNSLLHRLTCMLVKMSCHSNRSISFEAIKCLGELGPGNLNSLVLQPKEVVLKSSAQPFIVLTNYILSLLLQYIVDQDIKLKKVASNTLYEMLKYKDIQKAVLGLDFGYGPVQKSFLIPFLINNKKTLQIQFHSNAKWTHDGDIWCPPGNSNSSDWILKLVSELLQTFKPGSYLKDLLSVCEIKVKFCENILPLLINLLLQSGNPEIILALSQQLNTFFANHWALTVPECREETSIVLNKKAVKSMLNVINFTRQQLNNNDDSTVSFEDLDLNYLYISKAAAFCSAHFTALLYGELWCRKETQSCSYESGYSILNYIYEKHDDITGITLQNILQNAYKAIGDLDSLSGCGFAFLSNPEYRVEHYKKLGQWDKVMNYYSSQFVKYNDNNCLNLIESFKMNRYYQLPILCSQLSSEPQYECLWRLGQWNISGNEIFKTDKDNLKNYEKDHFNSLKALVDGDKYTFLKSKEKYGLCIIENLKHTSLESSKNLYPILMQLQCLVEMDDFAEMVENQDFDAMFKKWDQQIQIISKNDFELIEPIVAQRFTLLDECVKKYPQLKEKYFKMILDFSDYAKNEQHIKVAENIIARIKKQPDLPETIKNEILFRDSQLAWLGDDKMIAQQLIRKLLNNDVSDRLKASILKMQAEHMTEIYSDRNTILQIFNTSIDLLETINSDMSQMNPEDQRNCEDTFDKIATFSDKQYQQIVNHMKSDLFQKKVANMRLSKRSCCPVQRSMSDDAKKAVSLQQRQTRIEEIEINNTEAEKETVLCLAVKFYLKNLLLCDTNNIKIFRVMSLLLDNRDNKKLASEVENYLSKISSYKYITMLPQLVPHISQNPDFFSQKINMIVEKCANDHPHHTLPQLFALVNSNKDKEYTKSTIKHSSSDRIETAKYIVSELGKNDELKPLIIKMKYLSDALIELAYSDGRTHKSRNNIYSIPTNLKIHKIKHFNEVLVPTCSLSVKKNNRYENIEGIVKFSDTYANVGGINSPKRIECVCTTGEKYSQLLKGQDDLRQDAVMQQVFGIITDLLSASKQTKNMLIRTYKIVPLSMRSGILEWVANSKPIGLYLRDAHHCFRPKDMKVDVCKKKLQNCVKESAENKLKVYNDICRSIKPVFHKFFETQFPQPSVWYDKRKAYTNSVATTSMCGYILGIGDRHVSNILVDEHSAELIHIDFGIAFEQGKCLPTPETVPFRLTRDIVDGMGVSGVEGLFRKACEKTMEVLRTNSQTILAILEVLLYDPLYFWAVTSSEANKRQTDEDLSKTNSDEQEEESKNISAETALLRSKCKLQGTEEGKLTSVQQQVEMLIQQAMDPANLCRLFHGWQSYL